MMTNMVQQYGLSDRMAGAFALEIPVLDIESRPEAALEKIMAVGRMAVARGAEVLVLGCAGMTGFKDAVENELKVTVIDPVTTGYAVLKSIVDCGLNIAGNGLYQPVADKPLPGMETISLNRSNN